MNTQICIAPLRWGPQGRYTGCVDMRIRLGRKFWIVIFFINLYLFMPILAVVIVFLLLTASTVYVYLQFN